MLGGNSQPQFYSGQSQGGLPASGLPGFSSQQNYLPRPQTDSIGFIPYPNFLQGQQHPEPQFLSPAVRYPGQFPYFPFYPNNTYVPPSFPHFPFNPNNTYVPPSFPYFPFNPNSTYVPPSFPFFAMYPNHGPSNSEPVFSAADEQLLAQTLRDNKKTKTLAEIFGSLNDV